MPGLVSARQSTGGAAQRRNIVALPEYQPLDQPLTAEAHHSLTRLLQTHSTNTLSASLKQAVELLSECAADVNDNHAVRRQEFERQRARLEKQDKTTDHHESEKKRLDGVEAGLDALAPKVDKMTEDMDLGLRKMLDDRESLSFVSDSVKAAIDSATAESEARHTEAQTQMEQSQRVIPQRNGADDGDEFNDFTPTEPNGRTQATPAPQQLVHPPSVTFKTTLARKRDRYQSSSLYDRYATNNEYKRFKREVHDAKHPGDNAPPMAPERQWFKEARLPQPGMTLGGGVNNGDDDDDDDDDLAVARETISTKCPITLREFEQPVTSTKCTHSFEKHAIMELIARAPGTGRGAAAAAAKTVECPVHGCGKMLTAQTLTEDSSLKRKIARLQRAARMAEEEADADGGAEEISSDDDAAQDVDDDLVQDEASARRVKAERLSSRAR